MIEDIVRKSEEVVFYSNVDDNKVTMLDSKTYCSLGKYDCDDKNKLSSNCL